MKLGNLFRPFIGSASPPTIRSFIGGAKLEDLKERERCEDRELEGCLVAAKDKCVGFAKEKCWKPFREARIA
ncbi:hypothetical protein OIU77_025917, partial [Salix suchowensis]